MVELLDVVGPVVVFLVLIALGLGALVLIWVLLAQCFEYLDDKFYDLRRSWRARKKADKF